MLLHLDWHYSGAALLQPSHIVVKETALFVIFRSVPRRRQDANDGRKGKVASLRL
jgi:hypothetical protein